MFGKEFSDNILKNNPLYVFNVFENNSSQDIKKDVYALLKNNNVTIDLVDFVDNVADNIKRIGVLHIKTVDFKLYNNTNAPSSSSIEFDMYWQKHDYDYSKVQVQ